MPGTKRVINIGTNPDDGTGDLLRDALNKVNLNFDDVWEYTSVNSNLNITNSYNTFQTLQDEVHAQICEFLQT